MIVRITTGKSFEGAALYFLHDKRQEGELERLSDDRVAWTDSLNTVQSDPLAVIREMQATAMNQSWLRQQSGHGKGGRPTERCVMSVSLSWHPEQQPDAEHMKDAAKSFLERMGYGGYQALLVAHNDTAHKHVHIILNTIHPDTGLTLDRNWSKLRAAQWRMEYERQQGKVYTSARAKDAGAHHGEWQAWQEVQQEGRVDPDHEAALRDGEWKALKEDQKQERTQFWKETAQARKELRHATHDEVREEFRQEWTDYAQRRDARRTQSAIYNREVRNAVRHYRRRGPLHGTGMVKQIKERHRAYHKALREDLAQQRADIHARRKARTNDLTERALKRLAADRAEQYQALLQAQREQKSELRRDQAEGVRRHDLLERSADTHTQVLTVEQIKAYKEQAIAAAQRDQDLDKARAEIAPRAASNHARTPAAAKERTDGVAEREAKVNIDSYRRASQLARAMAQQRSERESTGRQSSGRER